MSCELKKELRHLHVKMRASEEVCASDEYAVSQDVELYFNWKWNEGRGRLMELGPNLLLEGKTWQWVQGTLKNVFF